MKTLAVCLLLLLSLVASPARTEDDLIEVTIRCPYAATTVDINWKNHLDGGYSDTSGQSGKLDFEIISAPGPDIINIPFKSVERDGQKIRCIYRVFCPGTGAINARYAYKVNRKIVSCSARPSERKIVCKVKP